MVHGIVCITLFISGSFFVTKKFYEKKKLHPAVQGIISLPSHQNGNPIRNIQSNPNIDSNGKNINILGDRSTISFISVIIISFVNDILLFMFNPGRIMIINQGFFLNIRKVAFSDD